jgi:hypothetical protein
VFIQHCKSMKEAGFKPKMVYRNLPPSHLYEKVRLWGEVGCLTAWHASTPTVKSALHVRPAFPGGAPPTPSDCGAR